MTGVNAEAIPVRNAWYLLLYAWDMAAWRGRLRAEVEASPSLLGLLARVLTDATRVLLRRNLGRAFSSHQETLRGVKGRIDFAGSLKRMEFEAGRARCSFSALDVDTPRNRILRATLHRLACDPRVDHAEPGKAMALRLELRALVRDMEEVALVPISSSLFRQLQLGRNDVDYALPLAVCELLHRLELPTEAVGDHALTALVREELTLNRLFERFVRNFWRTHLDGYSVDSERLHWFDELNSELVPSMQTDITLTQSAVPHRRIVVDTKFYKSALTTGQFGGRRFNSDNLYQIYAYLRTQEHRSEAHRSAEGMLLYPTTARDLDQAMKVQGHRIRVATVDLARPWPEIHDRLLGLIADVPQSTCAGATV